MVHFWHLVQGVASLVRFVLSWSEEVSVQAHRGAVQIRGRRSHGDMGVTLEIALAECVFLYLFQGPGDAVRHTISLEEYASPQPSQQQLELVAEEAAAGIRALVNAVGVPRVYAADSRIIFEGSVAGIDVEVVLDLLGATSTSIYGTEERVTIPAPWPSEGQDKEG